MYFAFDHHNTCKGHSKGKAEFIADGWRVLSSKDVREDPKRGTSRLAVIDYAATLPRQEQANILRLVGITNGY
jgi:hypothetical protein